MAGEPPRRGRFFRPVFNPGLGSGGMGMSGMSDMSGTIADSEMQAGTKGAFWRGLLAVVLALAALGASLFLGLAVADGAQGLRPYALVAGGLLAFLGLAMGLAWLAGLVHFGRMARLRAFYAALVDACGEACLVTDARGHPVLANAAYRELLDQAGLKRLAGVDNLYAGIPDVARRIYKLSLKVRDGEPGASEFYLQPGLEVPGARAGSHVWMKLRAAPMKSGHVLWRLSDITSELEDRDKAFASLQHIIDYLDNMPAGLFSADSEGRIIYLNATLGQWLGLDTARIVEGGLTMSAVLPETLVSQLRALAPRPGETVLASFHADLRDAGGNAFPARILHRLDFDAAGRPRPSRTLVLDLRDEESGASRDPLRLARFINNAPIGIAMAGADGRITMLNAALAQIASEARLGGHIHDIVPQTDRGKLMAAFRSVMEDGRPQAQTDVNILSASDTRAKITVAATGATSGEAGERGVTLYVIDTTMHQALMQQLEQGQKMQAVGTLVSGIAHDFNNMLTGILGFADMLLMKHRPEDPSFEQIMNIKTNAGRAAAMVRQLLAFSRKQTLQPKVLSLTDLLSDMFAMLRRIMGEKIELDIEHGRDLWPVLADPSQIDRVVMNLAVNARDAMPKGGRLSVSTRNVSRREAATIAPDIMPAADYILIEIADTGEGIPPEVLDKIYDPFFTTKEVGKGTGLGLSTVYGIVKQTGGYIFCDSRLGEGTTFRIFLPRHVPRQIGPDDPVPSGAGGPETGPVREPRGAEAPEDLTGDGLILLVEDEDSVRQLAEMALTSRGYAIRAAETAETALDIMEDMLARGEMPDLVVSDVVMPGMDGPTMMKELRKMGVTSPFVFMSGHAEDAFAESLEEGAEFTFLAKPFDLKEIAEAVKRALRGAGG